MAMPYGKRVFVLSFPYVCLSRACLGKRFPYRHIAWHRRHARDWVCWVVDLRRGVERVDVVGVAPGLDGGASGRAVPEQQAVCQRSGRPTAARR
jgi:hypothetical protein